MDGNIYNLLAQGFAREKWYKKGLEDAKNYLDPLFKEKQGHISLAAKTEANINAYKNSSLMKGGSPGYAIYDTKTDLLSFYEWSETIKRLKAAYDDENDAIYDIASILAPNNLEEFVDEKRILEHKTWFRADATGKKIANFEDSYLNCSAARKRDHKIPGIITPLRGMIFGDNLDIVLVRVDKEIEIDESKLFAQQYGTSGSTKLIDGGAVDAQGRGEGGGKISSYPILTPDQRKQVLLFESQQKEDEKSISALSKVIKTNFFSTAAADVNSNYGSWESDTDGEIDDL